MLHRDIQAGHQPHLDTWCVHLHNHYHQGDWNVENGQDSSYESDKHTVRKKELIGYSRLPNKLEKNN